MNLQPLKKNSTLTEQAYAAIKEAIYLNHLKPGTPLTEEQLSTMLSISRTPVRSALQQLVFEKLAVSDQTGHIFVSTITRKDVEDITVLRANLDPLSIQLAHFPLSSASIHSLKRIQEQQETLVHANSEDNYQYACLDSMFHTGVASLCDNTLLVETIRNMGPVMIRINVLSGKLSSFRNAALQEHADILRFLENGQQEFAAVAMRQHVQNVGERILSTLTDVEKEEDEAR